MTQISSTDISFLKDKKLAIGLIHKVYCSQLKNWKSYTASTKTKSEVRGGGKKPWRQKGTGNARSGSIRSSIWVGGGISFGPKHRIVKKKINKKEKKKALFTAFNLKQKNWHILSKNSSLKLSKVNKTNVFIKTCCELLINVNKKMLIILPKSFKNLYLATRNLKKIKIVLISSLNLKHILTTDLILFDINSLILFNIIYGKK